MTRPLAPNDAVFVVFRSATAKLSFTLLVAAEKTLTSVPGSWQVAFQPNRGAPTSAPFDKLTSYPENSTPGIKYSSGTATYTNTITAPASWFATKGPLWLNLGEVQNLAEVVVNGKPLSVCLVRLHIDRNKARAPLGFSGGAFPLSIDSIKN